MTTPRPFCAQTGLRGLALSLAAALALAPVLLAGCGPAGDDGAAEPAAAPTEQDPSTATPLASPDGPEETDRLILRYHDAASALAAGAQPLDGETAAVAQARLLRARAQAAVQAAGWGVQAVQTRGGGMQVVRLERAWPVDQLTALAQRLQAEDVRLAWAEPDLKLRAQWVPNDPLYPQQWHYHEAKAGLNLPAAWDLADGSQIVVAVIDTGVRPHEDLNANLLSGADLISDPTVAQDGGGRDMDASDPGDGCNGRSSTWHGTHVAGTIAAVTGNGIGVAGVAWGASVLPVRVLGCGGGYTSDIADGIRWAVGGTVPGVSANLNPARVLNLSLGGQGSCGNAMQSAIDAARAQGAVLAVAAGNSNLPASGFTPANCKGVITVAAVGRGGGRAPYSNYGPEVAVAAPGGNMAGGAQHGVLSTRNDGTVLPGADSYSPLQGTSMATPHVAGIAALMLSREPRLHPDEVRALIRASVRPFPVACSGCGQGLADAGKAVRAVFLSTAAATDLTEQEPNDTPATAQSAGPLPLKITGEISTATDVDTFRLAVPAGATVRARLIGYPSTNLELQARTAQGGVLLRSTAAAGQVDALRWTNTGTRLAGLHLRVHRAAGGYGATEGHYTLELSN